MLSEEDELGLDSLERLVDERLAAITNKYVAQEYHMAVIYSYSPPRRVNISLLDNIPLGLQPHPRQSATSPNTMSPSVNPTSLSCRCIPSYISLLKNWQGGHAPQCHACTKLSSAAMFFIPPGTLTRAEEWFRSQCEEFNQLADSLR